MSSRSSEFAHTTSQSFGSFVGVDIVSVTVGVVIVDVPGVGDGFIEVDVLEVDGFKVYVL